MYHLIEFRIRSSSLSYVSYDLDIFSSLFPPLSFYRKVVLGCAIIIFICVIYMRA